MVAPPVLNLVCFRHRAGDDATQRLMDSLNRSGKLYITHTRLGGKLTLRFSIGGTWTRRRHLEDAWRLIQGLKDTH